MKGIDYVIKKTASDLNLPEEIVKPVVMEYWSEVKRKLVHMESRTIAIRYVGLFTVSKIKSQKLIKHLINAIRLRREENKTEEEMIEREKLKRVLKVRDEIAIEYNEFSNIWKKKKQEKYGNL